MKRFLTVLATLVLVLIGSKVEVNASQLNGDCGQNLVYVLELNEDNTYTLSISGTGSMTNYNSELEVPWKEYAANISKVKIAEGVTSISENAFASLGNLKSVDMSMSIESIEMKAFPQNVSFEMLGWLNHVSGEYAENNPNINLKLKQLRVLTIGNSHTEDYTAYFGTLLGDIANQMDTEIVCQMVWFGGRQLILNEETTNSHYNAFYDSSIAGHSDLVNALNNTWDLVLVQDYRESVRHGAEFADDLKTAVEWIREEAPGAKVGWVADWPEPFYNFVYETGVEAIKAVQVLEEGQPDFIIPLLTIVENARSSYFGTTMNARGVSSATPYAHWFPILERDDKHMSFELGRYTIGAGVLYHTIQYFDELLIKNEKFDMFDALTTDPVYADWVGEFVDDYRLVIEEAAINSYKAPLTITQSQYTEDPLDAKYAVITDILEEELPAEIVKDRLNGTVVTDDIIVKMNAATDLNISADDITFEYSDITYTITVESSYGYSNFSKVVLNGGRTGIVDGYYYENGVKTYAGLIKIDGYYYYINSSCKAVTGSYNVWKTNGILPEGIYEFDADGKMINPPIKDGIVKENGVMYYYVDGEKTYAGLIMIDGDYYYVNSKYIVVTGLYNVWKTNDLLPEAIYEFDSNGKMINPPDVNNVKNGIVKEDGAMYYYVNGVKTYAGLVKIDGDYYYVNSSCKVVTGSYSIWKTNDLLPQATYEFDENGRMINPPDAGNIKNGIVKEDGAMYYYENGVRTYAGLIMIDGDYYYVNSSCKVVTGSYPIWKTNGIMEADTYFFDENGKMVTEKKDGIVKEDGVMYYYENGVKTYAGLIKIDGDYYYVNSSCKVVTGSYSIWKTNDLLPQAIYEFDSNGKMINPPQADKNGIVKENGVMYYYENGVKTYAGLIEIDGDYYYVNSKCVVVTGKYTIWKTNDLMEAKEYTFDSDGKMIQ